MPGVGAAVKAAASAGGKSAAKGTSKAAGKAASGASDAAGAAAPDLIASGTSTTGKTLPPDKGKGKPAEQPTPEPESELEQQPEPEPEQQPEPEQSAGGGVSVPSGVNTAGGFVLALMFWTWVALPFLKGGPAGVKNTLRAKFFNKAPDGSWLP